MEPFSQLKKHAVIISQAKAGDNKNTLLQLTAAEAKV